MAAQFERMMSQVSRWIGGSDATVPTDRQLLADYIAVKDESAFAILVRRNSPMVLGVCRRVLSHTQDSEDACQATFLILARKAASINKRESVRCWLYGVAFRVASHLRRQKSRRSTEPLVEVAVSGEDVTWREERRILDEELLRLPDQFRLPLLLCYLEGKTRDEAAEELGWSPSTFKGRLERGRERLRFRLERKGIGLSAALLATLSQTAESSAHGPTSIASLANPAGLSSVSPSVLSLAQGVLRTMLIGKVKALLGIAIVVGMLGTGVGALWNLASAEAAPPAIPAKEPSSQPAAKELPAKDPQVDKEFLAKVKKSRAAAIAWLKKTQKEDGMWEDDKNPSVRDGLTALVTLALLESGVEPADSVLAKLLKYLRGLESTYTYTVSLQTAALCRANSLKDAKTIQRNVDWLMKKAARDPKTKQLIGWSYGPNAANNADNSNTQFAVLALHAANRVGIEPKGEKNWV